MRARSVASRAVLLVAAALLLPATAGAQTAPPPATLTVNTTADGGDGACNAAECTLREAVSVARPVDTVVVPAGDYTVVTELVSNGDRIVGAGAGATIIRGGRERVIRFDSQTSTVSGVTITGGTGVSSVETTQGGGMYVAQGATLALIDSAVTGNVTTNGTGGGITSAGTLQLTRVTVSGNRSDGLQIGHVGGVYLAGGNAEIRNSTISGNVASFISGGLAITAIGSLVLENVTIADNTGTDGAGIFISPGRVTPTVAVDNVIVARNNGAECGGDAPAIAAWTGDHNLDDDGSCGFTATGDRTADPLLGPLAANGGPTLTHALPAGSPAVDAGEGCPATDQRGAARAGACDIGAYEYVPPPPPPTTNQPPPGLPEPVAGRSVNATPSGDVKVKLRGTKRFVDLTEPQQLRVGTIVDVRKGRVTLVAAGDQTATFYGGIFKIGQTKGRRPLTTLTLTEKLSCPRGRGAIAAAKKKKRRLWGDGKGRFRTKGKHSAATVVGTKWLVEDRCKSTLTRVVQGRVKVRDFAKRKTVTVRKGKRYVARAS